MIVNEALKRKLNSEGLFNVKHKKRIPNFPSRIGIVTSLEGSVIQDIINVSQRRTGTIDLIVSSSPVQGEKSSGYLVDAITKLTEYNKLNKIDIIIIARGGGSFEDLNCFNSEKLARKIFDLDIPIISGIGHETDYTIVDFVVDLRASTPSQAAELSTPNDNETIQSIDLISDRMSKLISDKVYFFNENFNNLNNRINLCNPSLLIKNYKQKVLNIRDKFLSFYKICKDRSSNNIKYYDKLLVNNNPYNILKRGFVVATNQNGKLIKKVKNINLNDKISVKFYDGLASTIVDSIDYENEKE